MILLVFLPFNLAMGLGNIAVSLILLITLQLVFYYFSRFRKQYSVSIICYAIVSYIAMAALFFFNSGSKGPTIFLFFLTFQLLIAFSANRWHFVWFIAHFLVIPMLMLIEYFKPEWVPDTYGTRKDYFIDLVVSYLVILVGIYWITNYLRKNYLRKKNIVDEYAAKIEQQHREILVKNAQLEKLNQEKTKLFSVVSHDLRTPLAVAVSLNELINDFPLEETERMQLQRELYELAKNTLDMFNNLQAWSSGQLKGGVRVNLGKVQVKPVVDKVVLAQQLFAAKKQVKMNVKVHEDFAVTADMDMLELIVRNLVQNAIKFTPVSGEIHIEHVTEDGRGIITIRDTGVGMTDQQIQNLFTLQLSPSYGTGNEKGSGIGLHLCKEFVLLQEGEIWVDSVINKGSAFYVALPV
ncbi:Signal transduction histidine kinase [Filimonas lacunae]|uniref:histidine kinase n=2 Tax=Filimonas lacunae TaxID=477680 RepID=A0A1N7RGI6_9BACT|nr:Signal transduction histidine kinase [Filimonas lacunae]